MPTRMAEVLARMNHVLERRMFLVVLSGVALGWTNPGMTVFKPVIPFLFGYMTFATALGVSWRNVLEVAGAPGPVLYLLGLVHLVMPSLSFGLGHLALGAGSPYAAGLVLAACIPMAVTSVIWSGIMGGETSLSLTAVTIDSLLSPLVVPASVWFFLGRAVRMEVGDLFRGLLWMIVLPTVLGLTYHDLSKGRAGSRFGSLLGLSSKLALTIVVATNLAVARGTIAALERAVMPVLLLICVQTPLGFVLGWAAGRIMGYRAPRVLAFAFGAGLRNISAGAALAVGYFPPAVGLPVVLAFLLQQPVAAFFAHLFSRPTAGISL
ncbi:MAG: bile acid:sodium symporter family protein [Bacillota bacterium]